MHLLKLTLSREDGIRIVSNYSVVAGYLVSVLLLKYLDDLLTPAIIILKLFRNNSRIASPIKIPKIIPPKSCGTYHLISLFFHSVLIMLTDFTKNYA